MVTCTIIWAAGKRPLACLYYEVIIPHPNVWKYNTTCSSQGFIHSEKSPGRPMLFDSTNYWHQF